MTRQVFEENPGKIGSLMKQAAKASKTVCGCGKWHCELCGFVMFNKRVSRVRKNETITGYLTGGEPVMHKPWEMPGIIQIMAEQNKLNLANFLK